MTSLADLEARVAALEADRADYRAVLAAVGALTERVDAHGVKIDANRQAINAVGEKLAGFQTQVSHHFEHVTSRLDQMADSAELSAFRRSTEESNAELKDLIVRALDRPSDD